MVGLFAEELLRDAPGAAIIHDPRLTWNTIEKVAGAGGRAVQSKTGHAFIKERMRKEDAVYGGEMSAHHYFKRFAFCDSGMIPWLLLAQQMSRTGKSLKQLVSEMQARFPASGEINLHLDDAKKALAAVRQRFGGGAVGIDETDGISIENATWRLNVRASNTEPVVRVNVESRGDEALMRRKTDEVLALLRSL
jgi:phosphomannomutase